MFVSAQTFTNWPFESRTIKPPTPLVRVVPSVLGVLPTITHPLFNIPMAVLNPTPPGHPGSFWGSCANNVTFLVCGL